MEIPDQLPIQEIKPRLKNPKRVKAGLRSAEVRKQKAADVEAQLQKAADVEAQLHKLSQMKTKMFDEQVPDTEQEQVSPITVTQDPVVKQCTEGAWTPRVIGGLGLAAVCWYLVKPQFTTHAGRAVKQPVPPAP